MINARGSDLVSFLRADPDNPDEGVKAVYSGGSTDWCKGNDITVNATPHNITITEHAPRCILVCLTLPLTATL